MPVRNTRVFTLLNAKVITGAQDGDSVDVSGYLEFILLIRVSSTGGTSPTLDLDIEVSDDNTTFHKEGDITQITANGNEDATKHTNLGKYVRLSNSALGGSSTPTFTVTAILIAKN